MADEFKTFKTALTSPAVKHFQITASASDMDPRPRAIRCNVAGSLTIEDEDGTSLSYTLQAGEVIPFRGVKVTAIASGTFYAWT